MRDLLAAEGRPRLPIRMGRHLVQPDEQAAERLREALHGAGVHRQGLPDLGRHAARRGRVRRARASATASRRRRPTRSGRSAAVMRRSRSSSETRRRSAARHTSRRRSIEQYLEGERSRISGPGICASSVRANSARSGGTGAPQPAPFLAYSPGARGRMISLRISATFPPWHAKQFSFATTAAKRSTRQHGAVMRMTYSDARRVRSRRISAAMRRRTCPASRPRAAAAGRSPQRPRLVPARIFPLFADASQGASGVVGPRSTMER